MEQNSNFFDACQCKAIGDLMQLDTRIDRPIAQGGQFPSYMIYHGDLAFRLDRAYIHTQEEAEAFRFGPLEHRLLVVIRELYAKCSDPEITIWVRQLMEKFGLRCMDDFREQLATSLESLLAIQYKADPSVWEWDSICSEASIHHGLVKIQLTPEFAELLKAPGLVQIPKLYYALKRNQYKNAPALLHFIAMSRYLSNKTPQRRDIITIKSLLSYTTLPDAQAVRQNRNGNGSIKERIIEPFFRELHGLDPELTFSYKSKYGDILTEEAVKKMRYEDFIKVKIHFQWKNEDQLRKYEPKKKGKNAKAS